MQKQFMDTRTLTRDDSFLHTQLQLSSWKAVKRDQPKEQFEMINFGGYGGCPDKDDPNNDSKLAKNSKCKSGGPDCVWSNEVIDYLPNLVDVTKAGYNAISLDIEGVTDDFNKEAVLSDYLIRMKGVKRIITVPGFGVQVNNGGMDWLTQDVVNNTDYILLMYYNQGNDTEA